MTIINRATDIAVASALVAVVVGGMAFPFAFARVSEGPGPLERQVIKLQERVGAVEAKQVTMIIRQDTSDATDQKLVSSGIRGDQLNIRLVILEDRMKLILWLLATIAAGMIGVLFSYLKQVIIMRRREEGDARREKKIDDIHEITNGRMTEMISEIRRALLAEARVAVDSARKEGIAIGEEAKITRKRKIS